MMAVLHPEASLAVGDARAFARRVRIAGFLKWPFIRTTPGTRAMRDCHTFPARFTGFTTTYRELCGWSGSVGNSEEMPAHAMTNLEDDNLSPAPPGGGALCTRAGVRSGGSRGISANTSLCSGTSMSSTLPTQTVELEAFLGRLRRAAANRACHSMSHQQEPGA